jgi:ELWxxDGT repeat protein
MWLPSWLRPLSTAPRLTATRQGRRSRRRRVRAQLRIEPLEDRIQPSVLVGDNPATLVKDITPGREGSNPISLTSLNGSLLFITRDATHGASLWKSDGTQGGTQFVAPINPFSDVTVSGLTVHNGMVYFAAADGDHGFELWKSDGTGAGTVMVADINPGPVGSVGYEMVSSGTLLYFIASDGSHGREVWKSDGTAAGTSMVADVNPTGDSNPYSLTVVNDTLYFMADDGTHGYGLWRSDGSQAGTQLVSTFSLIQGTYPSRLVAAGNTLYFVINDRLWKSDGTTAGTVMVAATGGHIEWERAPAVLNGEI